MRRKDLEISDTREIEAFLTEQHWGLLSMADSEGHPYSVPLNYLYWNRRIYLHGAAEGKKIDLLKEAAPVQFTVVKEYAHIPSYFTGSKMACGASQFFKSVMIFGKAAVITDIEEKITVFSQMMKGFQPEGNYQPMQGDSAEYRGALEHTCLIEVIPEQTSAKFKFGQGASEETIERIIGFLEKRNAPLDRETISNIRKYRS